MLGLFGCQTYRLGLVVLGVGVAGAGKVLGEARVLAVLVGALCIGLALGALVHAVAVVLHHALARDTLGAGGSARARALLGLLGAGRLLVGVRGLGLRVALGAGRPGGVLGLLGLLVLVVLLGLLLLGLLLLGLLLLGLLLLGLSLFVVLVVVLVMAVVGVGVGRGPQEVGADRGDGQGRDEPLSVH